MNGSEWNGVSNRFYNFKIDKNKCTSCHECAKRCEMNIEVQKNPNSTECIRCGNCMKACSAKAIIKGING